MLKINSKIYKNIKNKLIKENPNIKNEEILTILNNCGYFKPNDGNDKFKEIKKNVNILIQPIISEKTIKKKFNKNTIVGYYCGSFSYFHQGHIEVIKQFINHIKENHHKEYLNNNYAIVIAPANVDYLYLKYPQSNYIQNKNRYDNIIKSIVNNFKNSKYKENIYMDLNPMLNNYQDYNFTDLIENFIKRNKIKTLNKYILCGKDRSYFKNIEKHTEKIKVFFVEEIKDKDNFTLSSQHLINQNPNDFKQKNLYLRCYNENELNIFKKYLNNEYIDIIPIFIKDEIKKTKKIVSKLNKKTNKKEIVTICKEYKKIVKYIKFSRKQYNPLSDYFFIKNNKLNNKIVIDSDIYSGITKDFLKKNNNVKFYANIDLSNQTENYELLDIDDFYNEDFGYPFIDLSSKCSLRPFNKELHDKINNLKKELKEGIK